VSKLQEALEEVQNTHIKEVDEMNAQLERQRDRTEDLTEAVSTLISFIFQSRLHFWFRRRLRTVSLFSYYPSKMRARDEFGHARDRRATSPLHARTRVRSPH